jgi:hypothetical protein
MDRLLELRRKRIEKITLASGECLAFGAGVWERESHSAGISARVRTQSNVLLSTLDDRPIRRDVLGKRKAPGT